MSGGSPNLYDALGLTPEASREKIRKTCKKMVRSVRESDSKNSEKNELIRFIKKSRDTLIDSKSREEYDRTIGIETLTEETHIQNDPLSTFMGSMSPLISSVHGSINNAMEPVGINSGMVPYNSIQQNPFNSLIGNIFGSDISRSVIPEELISSMGTIKSGGFHVMEYTRVRNEDGSFDEYGFTKEGDANSDCVKEKRFHKRS
jgi:hypothetical protein